MQPKLLPAHFTHTKPASTFTFEMDRRKYPCEISTWTVNTQVHHTSTDRILCIDLYDLYAEKETKWPNIQMVNLVTTCALRSRCLFEAEPALRLQSQTLDHSIHSSDRVTIVTLCPSSSSFLFLLQNPLLTVDKYVTTISQEAPQVTASAGWLRGAPGSWEVLRQRSTSGHGRWGLF